MKPMPGRTRLRSWRTPILFGLWHALAYVAEMLPQPPITRNQVELMQTDSVASPGAPGFADLRQGLVRPHESGRDTWPDPRRTDASVRRVGRSRGHLWAPGARLPPAIMPPDTHGAAHISV